MNGFDLNTPCSFTHIITIYDLDEPLATALSVNEQVHRIYATAKLAECNPGAAGLSGAGQPGVLRGMTMQQIVEGRDREKISAARDRLLDNLHEFISAGYYIEDIPDTWPVNGQNRHFKSTYCGFVAAGRLRRILVFHCDDTAPRHLKQLMDNSASGMFVAELVPPISVNASSQQQVQGLADQSRLVEVNQAFLQLFHYSSEEEILGGSLFGKKAVYDFAATARDFVSNDYCFEDYLVRFALEDRELWISMNVTGMVEDGHLVKVLGLLTNISDRVNHTRIMEYRARHDPLTDLPSRSYFIEQVDQAKRMHRPGSRHALLLLDLDGFKEINDTLGHEIGDYLLQQIGPRLEALLASGNSLLTRLGGDEFAIFIENYRDREDVKTLATDIISAIKRPFPVNELELVIGGSIGIALYPENAESVSSLLRCADVAMYQAKRDAIDFCLYSTQQDYFTVHRLSLMMDIRQCIANEELLLFYQPIISLASQEPVAFEALIRWQHPRHGLLPPSEFIPLIELTEMIVPVTWWVVESAVKQLALWRERGWDYQISVNVSARNLIDERFVGFIAGCLRRYAVEGRCLEIEITESTLMVDPEKARRLLRSLSGLGITISIDDYGTGYSSLAYLKSLPINTLKIDQTFIRQMLEDNQDRIIVNSTIQLAHNLGLGVTAEGIEEAPLVDELLGMGCDKGQGYYICRPVPVGELEAWLQGHSRAAVVG